MKKKNIITTGILFFLILFIPLTPVYACKSWDRKKITIIRDDYGVPHVFAKTKEGLGFGPGYAMAQDRLWQADVYRRSAFGNRRGNVAQRYGRAAADLD